MIDGNIQEIFFAVSHETFVGLVDLPVLFFKRRHGAQAEIGIIVVMILCILRNRAGKQDIAFVALDHCTQIIGGKRHRQSQKLEIFLGIANVQHFGSGLFYAGMGGPDGFLYGVSSFTVCIAVSALQLRIFLIRYIGRIAFKKTLLFRCQLWYKREHVPNFAHCIRSLSILVISHCSQFLSLCQGSRLSS